MGVVALSLAVAACGGGGGGGDDGGSAPQGTSLEDLNLDGRVRILCFGDSITRGVGDGPSAESTPPAPAGYPARLQPLLAPETALPLDVIDGGRAGERTNTGVSRLQRDVPLNQPDYVILLEGSNDVEDGHTRDALDNMQRMIDTVFANGAMPLLGTITPSCCNHKNQLPEGAILAYNSQLRAMALNNSVPLIDFYAAFANGPQASYDSTLGLIHIPEGLHPTPAGYDLMAVTAQKIF
jgi:lysophospholipase L1-like esterase